MTPTLDMAETIDLTYENFDQPLPREQKLNEIFRKTPTTDLHEAFALHSIELIQKTHAAQVRTRER
jgi:hypothetical protein